MKSLKITLAVCGVLCLSGFLFAVTPWMCIEAMMQWVDLQPPNTALSVYVTRIALAICGFIGVFFIMLARNPLKYGGMVPLAAYGLLAYALLCLAGGIRYRLPVGAFVGDVVFGCLAGLLILTFHKQAIQESNEPEPEES